MRYEWTKEAKCKQYLESWVKDKKRTTRIEDLRTSEWCIDQVARMKECTEHWQAKQNESKLTAARDTAGFAHTVLFQRALEGCGRTRLAAHGWTEWT